MQEDIVLEAIAHNSKGLNDDYLNNWISERWLLKMTGQPSSQVMLYEDYAEAFWGEQAKNYVALGDKMAISTINRLVNEYKLLDNLEQQQSIGIYINAISSIVG